MNKKVTVQKDEALWSIAERELGDPNRWIDIVVKNMKNDGVRRNFRVREGTVLELPEPGFDPSANFNPSGH